MSALSQETRFKIFEVLIRAGPDGMAAGEIAAMTKSAANSISAHLAILDAAGLVRSRKSGRSVIYRAVPQAILDVSGALANLLTK